MNSKTFLSILLIIIISSLIISPVKADLTDTEKQIDENVEKLEKTVETIEKVRDKDFRGEFIKGEWTYFLNKTGSGKILIKIDESIKKTDPFWNLVLGANYSFSWGFWIALTIWFILFFIFLPPSEIFFGNKIYSIIGSFAITSLIGLSGVIRKATDLIGTIINNKWTAIIIFILSLLILVIAKKTDQLWKNIKEREAKKREEQDRKILEAEAENIKDERTTREEF